MAEGRNRIVFDLVGRAGPFVRAFRRARMSVRSLWDSVGGLRGALGGLAAYFGARSIVNFFRGAVQESANFETAMANVQAVTQASGEEMDRLRAKAVEMGETTTFVADDAAAAMETLSRAGLNTQETLDALPNVLSLARGNSIELAEAASLVTRAANGMGIAFEESGRVADVLTRASQRANTNVTGLGQALSYAAPTARSLGLELEETAALVGLVADQGIDASRAGTALNNIFSRFQDSGSTFRRELANIGITTDDFREALLQLEQAGESGEDAINAVGMEAGPALRALLSEGSGALQGLVQELHNSQGAAQESADIMDDTLNGAIERLGSAWNTLKRNLGDNVLDQVKEGIDELAAGVRNFARGSGMEEFGRAFSRTFGDMRTAVREFLRDFDISSAMDRARQAMDGLGAGFRHTAAAARFLGNVFGTIFNGIKTVAGGVATFVVGALTRISDQVADVGEALTWLPGVSEQAAAKLRQHADAMMAATEEVAEFTRNSVRDTSESVLGMGQAFRDLAIDQEAHADAARDSADAADEQTSAFQNAWAAHEQARSAIQDAIPEVTSMETLQRQAAEATRESSEASRDNAEASQEEAEATRESANAADEAAQSMRAESEQARETSEATDEASDSADRFAQSAAQAGNAGGGFGRGMAAMLTGVSDALSGASQRVQELWQSQVEGAARAGRSVRRYMQDVGQSAEEILGSYRRQQSQFDALMQRVDNAGDSVEDLSWLAGLSADRFSMLGEEQLRPLRQAIDNANQRLERMRESAEGTLQSLQDELLQLQGREEELAERRRERRRQEIREQLGEARAAGDDQAVADLQQALRTLDRIAREEQRQRREEQEQQRRQEQEQQRREGERRRREQQETVRQREQQRRAEQPPRQRPSRTVRIQLDSGEAIDAPANQAEQFVRALERKGMSTS